MVFMQPCKDISAHGWLREWTGPYMKRVDWWLERWQRVQQVLPITVKWHAQWNVKGVQSNFEFQSVVPSKNQTGACEFPIIRPCFYPGHWVQGTSHWTWTSWTDGTHPSILRESRSIHPANGSSIDTTWILHELYTLKCHMRAEMDTTWYNWHYLGLPYSFNKMCSWNLTWILIHNHSERNLIEGSVPKTIFHIKFQFGNHAQHHVWNQIPLQTKSQITSAAILVSAMRSTVKQPRTKVSLKISFHTYCFNSTCFKKIIHAWGKLPKTYNL